MISYFFCLETARKYAVIQIKKILNDAADVRPNISGTTKILRPEGYNGSEDTGSLYLSDFGNEGASGNDYPRRATLNLDSSLSSTLYKNIETIQPLSGYTLIIIKV